MKLLLSRRQQAGTYTAGGQRQKCEGMQHEITCTETDFTRYYCVLVPLCILCTNNACVTGPCLQQHLRYVYVSHTPTRYVNEYVRQNATRAGQMKLVPTAFGPLVEHDDMVCLLYTMRHYV